MYQISLSLSEWATQCESVSVWVYVHEFVVKHMLRYATLKTHTWDATWLILPVVICLSQRLSHACLSINIFIQWNCVQLIKSVIIYLMVPYYMDTRSNSRANTCVKSRLLEGMYLLDKKPMQVTALLVIHSNFNGSHGFTSATVHSNFCPISFRR